MPEIILPHLGYATREGAILVWLKALNDPVAAGEAVVEVALEKTVHLVTAPCAGVLLAHDAPPGAIVPEGERIGWVGAAGETPPPYTCRLLGWEEEIAPAPPHLEQLLATAGAGQANEQPQLAVPPGAVPIREVEKRHRGVLHSQMRRVTSQRMARSWLEAPKVDLFADVDVSGVEAHRRSLKEQGQEAPSYNVYIAHAVVKAFTELPQLNFRVLDGQREVLEAVHVGMAVAVGENLVTVSLREVQGQGLLELQRRFKGLIRKALRLNLSRDELYGSSLTVTNLGEYDVSAFTAIINPPESYILAIGKVEPRPVVRGGAVSIATMCTFVLSFDHRVVDGAPASRLLQSIKRHMEAEPGPL